MGPSIMGNRVLRTEDPSLLTGEARYVSDIPIDGALHAVFVRSPVAHGRIRDIDTRAAASLRRVVGVFTAADLALPGVWRSGIIAGDLSRPALARERVRFMGEPVAVVVAETLAEAMDAAEMVLVDYDLLPVVVDLERAAEPGSPLLFPEHGTNVAVEFDSGYGEPVMDGADVVARGRFVNQRLAPLPMETGAVAAVPDEETGGLTLWVSSQTPQRVKDEICEALGLEPADVRVIAPWVGGAFGAKQGLIPEHLVVATLARRFGRPVRHAETRSENLVSMTHGRGQLQDVEIGARRDGEIVGLSVRLLADMGAYPGLGVFQPLFTQHMASGPYRIPRVGHKATCVVTNTTPMAALRGAGRPEATALIERAMDLLAREVDMDPVELRRRNLLPPDAFPHTTAIGATYDTGDYEQALNRALSLAGYEELRNRQAERRSRGDVHQLGVGVSSYVELTGYGLTSEFGSVEIEPDGTAVVRSGISPQGQGHHTSMAQITAGLLHLPVDRVRVLSSDTAEVPKGEGTFFSRSLQVGGSAVLQAGEAVVEKARGLASHLLEVAVEDVVQLEDDRVGVRGVPDRSVTLAELAVAAHDPARLPEGMEPGLRADVDFDQGVPTYAFGSHVAVVDVDTETGRVRLLRHVAVDDCGRILNPMLAEGQVHGGLAMGIAQALFEEMTYDQSGNPLQANLMTYAMPSASDLPPFETDQTETPTTLNPLGAKGIGESATIGSTPAVQNAVVDALAHLSVRHIDMPLTSERVWRAIREARPAEPAPEPTPYPQATG